MNLKRSFILMYLVFITIANSVFSQSVSSNTITAKESEVFFTEFKSFCRNKDLLLVKQYVAETVFFQSAYFGEIESEENYTHENIKDILPDWNNNMENVTLDKSVIIDFGENGNVYWAYSAVYNNPNEYIYYFGKNGPVSYLNAYFFKKIDGVIKLYRVVWEEL